MRVPISTIPSNCSTAYPALKTLSYTAPTSLSRANADLGPPENHSCNVSTTVHQVFSIFSVTYEIGQGDSVALGQITRL